VTSLLLRADRPYFCRQHKKYAFYLNSDTTLSNQHRYWIINKSFIKALAKSHHEDGHRRLISQQRVNEMTNMVDECQEMGIEDICLEKLFGSSYFWQ